MRINHVVSVALVILLIFHTTGLASLFLIPRASAQPDAKMWVTPSTSIYEKGDTFTITLWLNDTDDPGAPYGVVAWELELSYESSVIDFVSASEGSYLRNVGATFFTSPTAHADPIGLSCFINGAGAAEGPGDLVSVTFQVKENGKSKIDLFDTLLYESTSPVVLIPQTEPADGSFYTTYPKASFYFLPSTTAGIISGIEPPYHLRRDPLVNETIVFNATAYTLGDRFFGSYDPNTATLGDPTGAITNYVWNFGDGSETSGNYSVITHSFSISRTFYVNLTVTDDEGKSERVSIPVVPLIRDVAVSVVDVTPTLANPGEVVSIKVNITNYGTMTTTERVNVTLFQNDGVSDTLIPYNISRGLFAWSNVHEMDPVGKSLPWQFLPGAPPITLNYTWQTAGLPAGNYTIWTKISQVDTSATHFLKDLYFREMDLNLTNNTYTWGQVELIELPNIAVTKIVLTPTLKSPNIIDYGINQVTVQIEVKNTGSFDATFNLTLRQDSTLLAEWTDIFLASETSTNIEYTWVTLTLSRGLYRLTAQASNITDEVANGRTGDNKLSLNVLVTSAPTVTFTISPAKPLVGEFVQIDASASQAAPGWSISSYTWRINNVTQATYQGMVSFQHRFTYRDTFNVTLTVTDNATLSSSLLQQVHVGYLPVAQFTFSPTGPKVDQTVSFDASSSAPDTVTVSGDEIMTYLWDFGDGGKITYTGANLTEIAAHTYAVSGNFSVTLKVFDSEDFNVTITKFVLVTKLTSGVTVNMNAQTIQVGQSVTISGQVTPIRSGVQVSILYKTATTDWTLLQAVTSDQTGNYQYAWTINTAGNYTVKAQFAGDNKYASSESTATTIEVEPATEPTTPFDYTPYIIGAAVIVVILGVAVFLIKRRQ